MSLTLTQEAALTGGGDCQEHYHLSDRQAIHQTWRQYLANEKVLTISSIGTSAVLDPGVDVVLCSAVSGTTNVQLPNPALGLRFTAVKVAATGSLVLTPSAGLINGAATFTLTGVAYAYATFKAISGNYYRVG